ncbi:MAG: hypothetical protein PVI99_04540 [Anaerolineales bacterium]
MTWAPVYASMITERTPFIRRASASNGQTPAGAQDPGWGLWIIGQQSESGGGVFNVLPAANKVAKRVQAEA